MLRSLGKTCFASAYTLRLAARRFAASPAAGKTLPFIACYHRVVANFDHSAKTSIPSMLISTAMLERHIDWMAKRFSIVSLDDIGRHLQSERTFGKPVAAITFDDGYSDVYHHALPLLRRKGIPAAVFVVTGLVGTGCPQIFDRLYVLLRLLQSHGMPLAYTVSCALRSLGLDSLALNSLSSAEDEPFRVMTILLNTMPRNNVERAMAALERSMSFDRKLLEEFTPLTWEMLEAMHKSGITIGSHTKSHSLLTSESFETARQELAESKRTLESKLKTQAHHFAYPDGRFNARVVEAVRAAGYQFAYGICHQRDPGRPLLTIPRKVLWERSCLNALGRFSSSIMNCHVHWAFDPKDRCEHDHSTSCTEEMNVTVN
jgi:peptidoglycan/xylan/chitin deacetylase (PgdA/CDA1 family)